MKSKSEIIRAELRGLNVLDLGGAGYGGDNAYERELRAAWAVVQQRTIVDVSAAADIRMDLNALPLAKLNSQNYHVATVFDVLEHLDHPVEVLRWIPAGRLIIQFPNVMSWVARRMEEGGRFEHQYSWTPYTAAVLLRRGGWNVDRWYYSFGKWSWTARLLNVAGCFCPWLIATGVVFHCSRCEKLSFLKKSC